MEEDLNIFEFKLNFENGIFSATVKDELKHLVGKSFYFFGVSKGIACAELGPA